MMKQTLCQLTDRGILRISGEDRRGFLQSLISNDVNLCTQNRPLYAALLTPQGKFLHDLFLFDQGETFLLDCEKERAEDLLKRLKAFKLRAKVVFENVTDHFKVWALWGDTTLSNQQLCIDPRLPALGLRGILAEEAVIKRDLTDPNAYYKHQLGLGVPNSSQDMFIEKSTLIECNIDFLKGISWTKGCYVGQELTARMHYRSLAKKRLFPVIISGPSPAPGSMIKLDHEDIGEIRRSLEGIGLALLNVEKAQLAISQSKSLTSHKSELRVYQPDWLKI